MKKSRTGARAQLLTMGVSLGVLAGLLAGPAFAAETSKAAPAAQSGGREDVLVTATKREEAVQSVPLAVTAITADKLEDGTIRDVLDLEGNAPNLIVDAIGAAPGGLGVSIRGISFQDIEKSFDPAIGVVLDSVYLGTNTGARLDNFDIERVEVLRGPQGVLFGKNTTGGALNIVRTRPTGDWGAKVSYTGGSLERSDVKAVVNLPLTDKGGIKVAGLYQSDNGIYNNTFTGTDQGGQETGNINVAVSYQFSENFDILFNFDYIRDRGDIAPLKNGSSAATVLGGAFGQVGTIDFSRDVAQNFNNVADLNLTGYILEANWDLGSWLLTSVTGYREHDEISFQDFDAVPIDFFSTIRPQDYEQFSQEIRAASNWEGPFDLIAGVYYWNAEYELNQRTLFLFNNLALIGAIPPQPPNTEQRLQTGQETNSWAIFAQLDWHLTETLTATLGGRYTDEEKEFSQFSRFFAPGLGDFFTLGDFTRTESWTDFSPKVGLDWKPSEDFLLYGSYAKGFKSGGFSGRANTPLGAGPYDPEEVSTFEVGFKSDLLSNRLRFNGAVFYNDFKDQQVEFVVVDPIAGQETVIINAEEAHTQGLEVELSWLPVDVLTLNLNAGWLEAEFDKFPADVTGPGGVRDGINEDLSNQKFRRAPEFQFGASGIWEFLSVNDIVGTLGLQYKYFDDYETVILNAPVPGVVTPSTFFTSEATGLVDAYVSFERETAGGRAIKLNVFGNNLRDEDYFVAGLNVGAVFSFYAVNPGRTWGAELTVEF